METLATPDFSVMPTKKMKITISDPLVRDAVYLAHKGKCFFTGRPVNRDEMVIDHLYPISKGGTDSFNNYVLTFHDLNLGKSNKVDSDRINRMQSVVNTVYAPRAIRIYEKLKKIRISKRGRKPKDLKLIRRLNLFWADDGEIEVLSNSPLVTEKNIYELLSTLDKFLEIAKRDNCDYCFDVWMTREFGKQIRSIWYQVGGKYFRLIRKTKYYVSNSPEKWAWVYFSQEYFDFLLWKEKEVLALEAIWDIEDEIEYKNKLREFCSKYPPLLKYRDQILK